MRTIALAETILPYDRTRSARRSVLATLDGSGEPLDVRPHALGVGATVNARYTVRRVLGAGGMGVVYRVDDMLAPERPLALKTLHANAAHGAALSLFKAEFRTMTELFHPNLARVYDFFPLEGTDASFFTMDYVDGSDALRATQGAPRERIVDVLVQTCRALAYVHSRGIVHYDLKPDNVLVDAAGTVKVVDFGIAGGALREGDAIRGTPHYMAPELTGHGTVVDPRADLYGLGIMLFELLFRRLPFEGSSYLDLLRQHHERPIAFTPSEEAAVPAWLRALVCKLAAKHPDERHRTANEVIEDVSRGAGRAYAVETRETRESYAISGRFVGRDAERDALWAYVRAATSTDARDGRAATLVAGQSGVGKSRLVTEIKRLCQLHRLPFLEVDCHEDGVDLAPIAHAVTLALLLVHLHGRAELLERLGPQLAKIVPSLAERVDVAATHPDPVRERAAVREAAAEMLLSLSSDAPMVVYVNDLQWAGEGTASVVRQLVFGRTEAPRARLALIGTYRDDEIAETPIAALLDDARSRLATIPLAPLGPDEVAQLVRSMLGAATLPASFSDVLVRATGGSPFFVEEVMRSLLERDLVHREEGTWATRGLANDLPIPPSIDEAFRRRAARLTPEERRVLELAAVHGKPLEADVLLSAAGLPADVFFDALSTLRARAMLRPAGGPASFTTAHDRIRETVALDLARDDLRGVHLDLARALEERHDATPSDDAAFDVADHLVQGATASTDPGLRVRAAASLASAAERATRATLYEAARRYLEHAVHLVEGATGDAALLTRLRPALLEVLYLVDAEQAERVGSAMNDASTDVPERAELAVTKSYALIGQCDYRGAYEHVTTSVERFGVTLPRRPGRWRMALDMVRLLWALRGVAPDDISEWPAATDPRAIAAIDVLAGGGMAASWLAPPHVMTVTCAAIRITRRHGVAASASSLLVGVALLLLAVGFDPRWVHGFARSARRIQERHPGASREAVSICWAAAFVGVWCQPLPEVLSWMERGFAATAAVGARQRAGAANVWITVAFHAADTVGRWRDLVARQQLLLGAVGDRHALSEVRALDRFARHLTGEAASPLAIEDDTQSDEALLSWVCDDAIASSLVWSYRARRAAVDGDWAEAARAAEASADCSRRAPVQQLFVAQTDLILYIARARTGARVGWSQRRLLRRTRRRAEVCPSTFDHHLALLEAETARADRRHDDAAAAYGRAIEGARRSRAPLDEALAAQLAADFWRERRAFEEARAHLERAASVYVAWGAARMAQVLTAAAAAPDASEVRGDLSAGTR